jgi:hypothetical protein
MSLASMVMWNRSTETAVRGSHIRSAFRNAAEGSIATTCTPSRHARGRAKSQSPTPLWSRPSTMPRTWPVSRSTIVVIHGSYRVHSFVAGSWKNRTDRYRCSSIPSILGARRSTSGRRRAASPMTCWTSHHEIPKARAVSDTARQESMTASTSVSRSRRVDRARRGTWGVASQNDFRSHKYSSQNQRRLSQRSHTAPATGMSRSFWQRRSLTLEAITPQLGHPGGNVDSTVTWRIPSRSRTVLATR